MKLIRCDWFCHICNQLIAVNRLIWNLSGVEKIHFLTSWSIIKSTSEPRFKYDRHNQRCRFSRGKWFYDNLGCHKSVLTIPLWQNRQFFQKLTFLRRRNYSLLTIITFLKILSENCLLKGIDFIVKVAIAKFARIAYYFE